MGSARILCHRKWAHLRTLHKGFQTAVGQLKLISNIRAFNPWANSVILPGSSPTAGPCKSLVWQPIACWMGQCELIARILWHRKWAHVRTLHKGFQTAVGQLELISSICAFNPWANSVIFPGSGPAAGPCESLVRSPFCAGWANASSLPKYYGVGSGPMQGLCIRDYRLLWANSNSSVTSVHLIHGPI